MSTTLVVLQNLTPVQTADLLDRAAAYPGRDEAAQKYKLLLAKMNDEPNRRWSSKQLGRRTGLKAQTVGAILGRASRAVVERIDSEAIRLPGGGTIQPPTRWRLLSPLGTDAIEGAA